MAIVKLKIRPTSEAGFLVTLTTNQVEREGFLPPLPSELESSFKNWQLGYRQIETVRSCIAPKPGMRLTPRAVTIHSNAEYTVAVTDHLNQWLNSGDRRWQPIRDGLIAIAQNLHQTNEEIRMIIDARDINLRRLPWQEWNLFVHHYPEVEIALSANKDREVSKVRPKSLNLRILVAVGRSDGINTKDDLKVIQELEKQGAEVVVLMQPSHKDLTNALWDELGYHIFVFTGHSGSREDGQIGWIELNDTDSLSIEQFKEALKQAINRGLQLAIFNSCDGLGLANQLAQLDLPQCIVMREPVPDLVAIEFLKYFFQEFSRNKSLFTSVQTARKRLEPFQSDYPGALWLPTICIEPNVEPLTWQGLPESSPVSSTVKQGDSTHKPKKNAKPWLLTSLVGSVAVSVGLYFYFLTPKSSPPSGTFKYGGSTSWAPLKTLVEGKIKDKWSEFKLSYYEHPSGDKGSTRGIKMLLDGQISFAQSSRPVIAPESRSADVLKIKLKSVPVAIDAIAIVVHPSLRISNLSVDQLKNIYTGKYTNWQQVGGPNLKITPYSRSENSGTTKVFQNFIKTDNFSRDVKEFDDKDTTSSLIQQVAKNPNEGGIYYASAAEVINQCTVKTIPLILGNRQEIAVDKPGSAPGKDCAWKNNKLNIEAVKNDKYPMTRKLYVIVKQDGQEDEKAGEFFANYLLTAEGQDLIEQAGFARVR
jgi:ABC-type phosphate transport system substrate-binding protein